MNEIQFKPADTVEQEIDESIGEILNAWKCEPPSFAECDGKRSNAKNIRAGLNFEKSVAKEVAACGNSIHGQWFEYERRTKYGVSTSFCQTDVLWIKEDRAIIVECKLTYTPTAWVKLRKLYLPCLIKAMPELTNIKLIQALKFVPTRGDSSASFQRMAQKASIRRFEEAIESKQDEMVWLVL